MGLLTLFQVGLQLNYNFSIYEKDILFFLDFAAFYGEPGMKIINLQSQMLFNS